jgi:DNA-binding transcriptional LysR family regulator
MKWTDRIGRRVKLRDLHIAMAVADMGSMSKAAEELAVSYPVVSKTIAELERTLGVKLFDRSTAGVEPTHYGRALLKSGSAVFDELRRGLQQIDSIREPGTGELRIGSSELMDAGFLPAIIESFAEAFPRAALQVRHSNIVNRQYDALRDREVELALGRLPVAMTEPDLVAEVLFDEPLLVAAGANSRFAKRRTVTLGELVNEPWVFTQRGSLPRMLQEEAFTASGVDVPTPGIETISLQLYLRLVESGRWLGLVPGSALRFGGRALSIKVLPIKTLSRPRPVGFITVKDRTLTPLAERFIACARKVTSTHKLTLK